MLNGKLHNSRYMTKWCLGKWIAANAENEKSLDIPMIATEQDGVGLPYLAA